MVRKPTNYQFGQISYIHIIPVLELKIFVFKSSDGTVDGKDDKEENTRKVVDIRIYYFIRNFHQLGYDLMWWWWLMIFF